MRYIQRLFAFAAAMMLGVAFALPAFALLKSEYPELEPVHDLAIGEEELAQFEERLSHAQRTDGNTFEIINTIGVHEETRSADYTVAPLNAWNGVITVNSTDRKRLQEFLESQGLQNASDAAKIAGTMAWLHNNLVYDGYHSGTYVYSSFIEKGGQCNVYNGALGALLTSLGYRVQLMRGFRANAKGANAHWWVELLTDAEPLVMECGNSEDGAWHYLGRTYAETHGGDRDYVKLGRYAYNGEEYEELGAAARHWGCEVEGDDAVVSARIDHDLAYTVSKVELLFAREGEELQSVATDTVGAEYNASVTPGDGGLDPDTADEHTGDFYAEYRLSEADIQLEPGQRYEYAFRVTVNGRETVSPLRTVEGEAAAAAPLPVETPQASPAPLQEEPSAPDARLPAGVLAGGAAAAAFLVSAALLLRRGKKPAARGGKRIYRRGERL